MPAKVKDDDTATFGHAAVTTAENYLLMAGLLAAEPDLKTATLPEGEWQTHLDEYAKSERS